MRMISSDPVSVMKNETTTLPSNIDEIWQKRKSFI